VSGTDEMDVPDLLSRHESEILHDWMRVQLADGRRSHVPDRGEWSKQAREFLSLLRAAMQSGQFDDIRTGAWDDVRHMLEELSRSHAVNGLPPSHTATFILSLKEALFPKVHSAFSTDAQKLANATWTLTTLLDQLALYTADVYQKGREAVISRQQQEMLELSTPVVALWEGVLAIPLIGTLDSARTQVVMENLLQRIVDTGAGIAIIDITGVPTVDTLVAQHLLKTVAAARLMGADCIISGIRPQIAQTIVHLGVDLQDVVTKATLADAFAVALRRLNLAVQKIDSRARRPEATPDRATDRTD